jgi:DNA-directed RNA polymerase subunit K/omega
MKNVVVIDKLTKVVPNKYEAIRVMAKEARRINNIILRSENWESTEKPTTLAMKRLLDNRLKYDFVEDERKKLDELTFGEEE